MNVRDVIQTFCKADLDEVVYWCQKRYPHMTALEVVYAIEALESEGLLESAVADEHVVCIPPTVRALKDLEKAQKESEK